MKFNCEVTGSFFAHTAETVQFSASEIGDRGSGQLRIRGDDLPLEKKKCNVVSVGMRIITGARLKNAEVAMKLAKERRRPFKKQLCLERSRAGFGIVRRPSDE